MSVLVEIFIFIILGIHTVNDSPYFTINVKAVLTLAKIGILLRSQHVR